VGKTGAFAGDFLQGFHRRLVAEGVANGDVQLLRTRAGDGRIIGYLYNFLHRRRVYAYQSGFERSADNRLKPGLVSHHLAIEMNRAAGQGVYDFLAGDSRYKRSLANGVTELLWLVVQRRSLKFAIENSARAAKTFMGR
jgi:CelD/BcsL family acetyltransferase involved in cellulose biosynthesis